MTCRWSILKATAKAGSAKKDQKVVEKNAAVFRLQTSVEHFVSRCPRARLGGAFIGFSPSSAISFSGFPDAAPVSLTSAWRTAPREAISYRRTGNTYRRKKIWKPKAACIRMDRGMTLQLAGDYQQSTWYWNRRRTKWIGRDESRPH